MSELQVQNKFKKFVGVKIRSIERMNVDFSNSLYCVNEAYKVREAAKIKDPLANYKIEKLTIDAVEKYDISEKVLYFNKTDGFKIARILKQSAVYSPTERSSLISLTKTLKKIHSLKIPDLKKMDYLKVIKIYKSKTNEKYYLDEKVENKILKSFEKLNDTLEPVVSFNNYGKNKVFFLNNKVKVVDFRYVSLNSPIFDIAYFSTSYDLSAEQEELLLEKYFGYKIRKKYFKLLSQYKKYIDLLNYYRYTYYFTESGEIIYFLEFNKLLEKII